MKQLESKPLLEQARPTYHQILMALMLSRQWNGITINGGLWHADKEDVSYHRGDSAQVLYDIVKEEFQCGGKLYHVAQAIWFWFDKRELNNPLNAQVTIEVAKASYEHWNDIAANYSPCLTHGIFPWLNTIKKKYSFLYK